MLVGRIALKLALMFAASFTQTAQAFFDPPWTTPVNPLAGEAILVNIRGGICDFILEEAGYPQITQSGNEIRIIEYGRHYEPGSPWCIDGVGTLVESIGAYPLGDYTLTVDLAYPHPVFGLTILNIGVVSFTVAAPPEPVSVPLLGPYGAIALLWVLVAAAFCTLRKRRAVGMLLALTCVPYGARAADTQTIEVLLSNAPGAPTPAQVVAWIQSSPRSATPPLQAFKVKAPLGGDFLIPERATGDFLTYLSNNQNSARKKLEDAHLQIFAATDIPTALAALQADPYVASAFVSPEYRLHSVELSDFEIVPELDPLGGETQYGFYSMNVDRAWQGGLKNQAQHVEHEHRSPCPSFLLGSSSPASRAAVR